MDFERHLCQNTAQHQLVAGPARHTTNRLTGLYARRIKEIGAYNYYSPWWRTAKSTTHKGNHYFETDKSYQFTCEALLVTGSDGQLGKEINALSNNFSQFDFIFTGKKDLNITNKSAIFNTVEAGKIEYIVNCAAYTGVDKAEEDKDMAFELNAMAPKYLAEVAARYQLNSSMSQNAVKWPKTTVKPKHIFVCGDYLNLAKNWLGANRIGRGKSFSKNLNGVMEKSEIDFSVRCNSVGQPGMEYLSRLCPARLPLSGSGLSFYQKLQNQYRYGN